MSRPRNPAITGSRRGVVLALENRKKIGNLVAEIGWSAAARSLHSSPMMLGKLIDGVSVTPKIADAIAERLATFWGSK